MGSPKRSLTGGLGVNKLYGDTTFGRIEVIEPLWRNGTGIERPFSALAGVRGRCRSRPLQRVMTDFGADQALGRVPEKLKEHDGIERPVSTIQRTTERHAERISEHEAAREMSPGPAAGGLFVGEREGSMVPVVELSPEADLSACGHAQAGDQRKGKVLSWKEVRLNRVPPKGRVTPLFGGNFAGGVEESGRQGWRCAAKAGFGPGSQLHAVGDGAPWIVNPVGRPLGAQGSDLVDFFPRCEYLGEAAKVCAAEDPQAWLDRQKDRLQANPIAAVLEALAPFVSADHDDDPVTACDRSLRHRLDQLDYQGAIQRGLPMGSGEIESAHRSIIQQRLKLPGAWWSPDHIETL